MANPNFNGNIWLLEQLLNPSPPALHPIGVWLKGWASCTSSCMEAGDVSQTLWGSFVGWW